MCSAYTITGCSTKGVKVAEQIRWEKQFFMIILMLKKAVQIENIETTLNVWNNSIDLFQIFSSYSTGNGEI